MNIPRLVDNKILASLASPGDTVAVRVVVRRVANAAPFRIHGKLRQYLAEYDRELCAHCIDVPLSVWMDGFPPRGSYRDNPSIAHDLQGNRSQSMAPLVFLVVPFSNGCVIPAQTPDANADNLRIINALRTLSEALGAPPIMAEAFNLATGTKPVSEIVQGLLDTAASAADSEPGQDQVREQDVSPGDAKGIQHAFEAAERMRKMRDAKKAKRDQLAEV